MCEAVVEVHKFDDLEFKNHNKGKIQNKSSIRSVLFFYILL